MKPKTLRRKRISKLKPGTGKRKGPSYTKEELRKGTLLMFSSLKTYKLLRKLDENGRWPCPATNRRHLAHFQCRWGIQDEMFSLYSLKLRAMNQSRKNVSLSFDESALKPQTQYISSWVRQEKSRGLSRTCWVTVVCIFSTLYLTNVSISPSIRRVFPLSMLHWE